MIGWRLCGEGRCIATITTGIVLLLSGHLLLCDYVTAQVDPVCRHPLGMQDKRIADSAITATSFHAPGTGPKYARLGRDDGDGAWCPGNMVDPNTEDEYLQITLPEPSMITNIATQGRYGNGHGKEFVKSYKFNYSRDGQTWFSWSDYRGVDLLQGNRDPSSIMRQVLSPAVTAAKYVRIIPRTSRPMSVCLRLELYGCKWTSGLISYDITTPEDYYTNINTRSASTSPTNYNDDSYDGTVTSRTYFGGLGQLTDGVIGDDDIRKANSRVQPGLVGFDYVGWSSEGGSKEITMTFRFIDVRNFTTMRLHCSNDITNGARLFASIDITFSLNGRTYPNTAGAPHLQYAVKDDVGDTSARFIEVPLRHAVARYIRARIQLRQSHLLISEIQFINDYPLIEPEPEAMLPPPPPPHPTWPVHELGHAQLSPADGQRYEQEMKAAVGDSPDSQVTNEPTVVPSQQSNIPIIVGCLVAVIILLVLAVLALCYRQHRLRKTLTPPRYSYSSGRESGGGQMVTLAPLVTQTGPNGTHTTVMNSKPPIPVYQEIDSRPNMIPHDNIYLEPSDVVMSSPPPYQSLPEVTQLAEQASSSSRRFDQPDVTKHSGNTSHYAETDLVIPNFEAQPIQGVSGNNIYAVPWSTPSPKQRRIKSKDKRQKKTPLGGAASAASTLLANADEFSNLLEDFADPPPEFPRNKLEFCERLGEGQFGEVQLCKADAIIRELTEDEDFRLPGSGDSPVLVAVKVLRKDASTNAKEDFLKEVKIMARMQDPNIVRLIAICTQDQPFAMITEYMENGDLNQYLRGFDDDLPASSPNAPGPSSATNNTISTDIIMRMAAQIASGMTYLASMKFVHRDLATRNVLVGADHSIRIADFGMSRNMYQSDYYRIQGRAVLPIRWMSWECVLMGKFSSASDVWAYGVTLWEMFSLCKLQPYSSLSDQQVIENMHHIFRRTGDEIYLLRPKRCPATLFNMIRQCWKRAAEERPTFSQMHNYLLEKIRSKPQLKSKPPQIKPPPLKK